MFLDVHIENISSKRELSANCGKRRIYGIVGVGHDVRCASRRFVRVRWPSIKSYHPRERTPKRTCISHGAAASCPKCANALRWRPTATRFSTDPIRTANGQRIFKWSLFKARGRSLEPGFPSVLDGLHAAISPAARRGTCLLKLQERADALGITGWFARTLRNARVL